MTLPTDYKKYLIKLIKHERKFEKDEMGKKLLETIPKYESNGKKTIKNVTGHFFNRNQQHIKFKSFEKIETEINELDKVLISYEETIGKMLEGRVLEKKSNSIIIYVTDERITKWGIPKKPRIDLFVRDSEYCKMIENLENTNDNVFMAIQYALNNLSPKNKKRIPYIKFKDKTLNKSQKNAIIKSLKSEDFFLIHGAFGTGKTKTLVELIYQEVKQDHKVLVSADSNAAVDNIVERLMSKKLNITRIGNDIKINKTVKNETFTSKFKKHPKYDKILKNKEKIDELKRFKKRNDEINQLYESNKRLKEEINNEIISKSQVILTTNSSAGLDILSDVSFDVSIIDEASQTTMPKVLIPISKSKKFILAGDHKQLPPTVKSGCKKLEETLFEKLITNFPNQKQFLNVQHRMNETLMKFPNKKFYNNQLKCSEKVKNIRIDCKFSNYDIKSQLVFLDTKLIKNNHEEKNENSDSISNPLEANLSSKIANKYLKLKIPEDKIGIITHYNNQVELIQKKTSVEVNTVDGFQGKEKEIIIISNVRSNKNGKTGFLNDKRINVALTRAHRKLIVIGNSDTLKHLKTFEEFISHCKKENCIIELENELIYKENKDLKQCKFKD